MVFGFTGSGNVSRGAQEIFDRLPYVELAPEELDSLAADTQRPRNVLYKTIFERSHRFEPTGGGAFDAEALESHPERFRSGLPRYLRHLTLLIHGAFWSIRQPRLITIRDLQALWSGPKSPRLRVIADIACDINGGIEATVKPTTPGNPVFVYDIERGVAVDGVEGNGPVVLAVDNLPCELPLEASEHFADTLVRFVPTLARCDWDVPLKELRLPRAISDAIIVHRGRLAPRFSYLERHLEA
jgi:alpha-aminoadipic semialdehyde synthase